jgi:hypothetical protein
MALVAAGVGSACGDAAGGNLIECVASFKVMNTSWWCKTQAFT